MAAAITINGVDWTVFFVDKTHKALVDDDGVQNAYGIALLRKCEIYLDEGLPEGILRKIITHELVHAVAFSYRVDLDSAYEEDFCEFTAAHFDEIKTLRKAILKAR